MTHINHDCVPDPDSPVCGMIAALIAREGEVPERGVGFCVEERRVNMGGLFAGEFYLRIEPAYQDSETQRALDVGATHPNPGDRDSAGGHIPLYRGTTREIFEYLKTPGIAERIQGSLKRLSDSLRAGWSEDFW